MEIEHNGHVVNIKEKDGFFSFKIKETKYNRGLVKSGIKSMYEAELIAKEILDTYESIHKKNVEKV